MNQILIISITEQNKHIHLIEIDLLNYIILNEKYYGN